MQDRRHPADADDSLVRQDIGPRTHRSPVACARTVAVIVVKRRGAEGKVRLRLGVVSRPVDPGHAARRAEHRDPAVLAERGVGVGEGEVVILVTDELPSGPKASRRARECKPSAPTTRSKTTAGAFSKVTCRPLSSCSRLRMESPNRISAPVTSRSRATKSPRMISTEVGSKSRMSTRATARSAASTNLMPSTSAVSALTRDMIPIRSVTSTAWPRTSTPFPPVRSAAARSTMTGRKPCRPASGPGSGQANARPGDQDPLVH